MKTTSIYPPLSLGNIIAQSSFPEGGQVLALDASGNPIKLTLQTLLDAINDQHTTWPSAQVLAGSDSPTFSFMAMPGYLASAVDPRTSGLIAPSKVTRITPSVSDGLWAGMGSPFDEAAYGNLNYTPVYTKQSPWSANDTYLLIWDPARASGQHLVNGSTYAHIRQVTGLTSQYRWFNSDSDKVAYIDSEPKLKLYTVSSNTYSVLKDFTAAGYTTQAFGFGGGEGNQSQDDRYWALCLQHSSSEWRIVCWDKQLDSILGYIPLNSAYGAGSNIDWWGISNSGAYLVTATYTQFTSGATTVTKGLNVWSKAGTLLRTRYNGDNRSVLNHCDLSRDSENYDVVVYIGPENSNTSNDKFLCTWRLDGSDGSTTRRQAPEGMYETMWHLSGRCEGWAVISTFPFSDAATTAVALTGPLHNHISGFKLDGSQNIYIVGQPRHTNETTNGTYYEQSSFAVPARTLNNGMLTKVIARSAGSFTGTVIPSVQHALVWEKA